MSKPTIIAYLKPHCGWSNGVRAVLKRYELPYEDRDIVNNPAMRQEMITKSGQDFSPCVEIDGQMLADVSGEEVESYLVDRGIVQRLDAPTDVALNAGCPGHGAPVVSVPGKK